MARKPSRNALALGSLLSNSPSTSYTPERRQPKKNQSQSGHACADSATLEGTPGRNLALGASSDNGGVGDDSGADAAESDEGNDEDGDGDAFAPSGRATEGRGVQAGHNNVNSINYEYGSDDVYDCVDMISDSDEDGPKVEKREEKNIVESEEDGDLNTVSAHVETSDGWEGFDLDDGLFLADVPYFDEQYGRSEPGVLASEMELFKSASVFDDFTPPPLSQSPRRVRFKEPVIPASDTSDIMSDDEDLNGLFNTPEGQSMPTGAYLTSESQNNEDDEYERSSCGSSSGYETDYGDTTDEEGVPASATKRPQALLRQPSLSSLDTDVQAAPSVKSPFKNPGAPAGYRRGPRMGSWIVDSTKPFAVIDSTGENMVICPARRPAKVAMICASPTNSSTSNPNITSAALQPMLATAPYDNEIDPSGFSRQVSTDAILGSETGMKAPIPTYSESQHLNDQTFAYSSVFFPIEDLPDISTFFDADDRDEDGDDDEELLNVEDFIDFGEDSSEDGEQDESEEMKHFDEGVISAFRRGQKRKLSDSFGRRPSFGVAARRRLIHQH